RHTRFSRDWSSDVCSSDLLIGKADKPVLRRYRRPPTRMETNRMTGTTRTSAELDPRRRRILFRAWHRGIREMDLIFGQFADNEQIGRASCRENMSRSIGTT